MIKSDTVDIHDRTTAPSTGIGAPLGRGERVGRYIIQQPIGAGGMGVVYEALDPKLGRKVALKLLHQDTAAGEIGNARLLREAQAMARLSHPNVVPIYDAGSTEGSDVFVAMELVEGVTLSHWLQAEKRSWRQVLRAFLFAGQGLAAAHGAGLVHRDFKPDNVLVGVDERVRVTDFGLVRSEDSLSVSGHDTPRAPENLALTHAGSLVGTPRFMSPEQLAARTADARSDQYAFCVAVWEALYGEHPFEVESLVTLINSQREQQPRAAPRDSTVPLWVRKALMRGLKPDPADRYPSMAALIADLEKDPETRRRQLLYAAGWALLALVTVGGAGAYVLHERRLCTGGEQRMAGIWDPAHREALARGFRATGKPFATQALTLVSAALDAYAQEWVTRHEEICAATRLRGVQPEAVMLKRMNCLEGRRAALGSLVTLLSDPDDAVLARASDAVAELPSVRSCAQGQAGISPQEAAHPAEAQQIRERIARAEALRLTGRFADAITEAEQAARAARLIEARDLEAQATVGWGSALMQKKQAGKAITLLRDGVELAEFEGDDASAEAAWELLALAQVEVATYPEAHRAGQLALAKVERMNLRGTEVEGRALQALALVEVAQGRYTEADARLQQALKLLPPRRQALALGGLSEIYFRKGEDARALGYAEQALALRIQEYGPDHPTVAEVLLSVGAEHHHLHQDDLALQAYQRALQLTERAYGPDSETEAAVLNNMSVLASDQADYARSLELVRRAMAIRVKVLGADHPNVGNSLVNEGVALLSLKRATEAEASFLHAEKIYLAKLGPEHPRLAGVWANLGATAQRQHHDAEALQWLGRASTLVDAKLGAEHPWKADILQTSGEAYLDLGENLKAEAALTRALAIAAKNSSTPAEQAEPRFRLAQAIYRLGRDRRGALELARRALADFDVRHGEGSIGREDIARWLAHPR